MVLVKPPVVRREWRQRIGAPVVQARNSYYSWRPMSRTHRRNSWILILVANIGLFPAALDAQNVAGRSCGMPRPLLPDNDNTTILGFCIPWSQVFADGNVKDVLGGGDNSAAASGALGLHYVGNKFDVTGLVNVAGTNDTIRAGYGSSLLVPAAGKGLNAGSLTIRRRARELRDPTCARNRASYWCNVGYKVYANASTRRWATETRMIAPPAGQTDSVEQVIDSEEVPIWGTGLSGWYMFFDDALVGSDSTRRGVSMVLDGGVLLRAVRGDIGAESSDALRKRLLGTDRTLFPGFEIGLTMIYDQIRSSFTYYYLPGQANGLTGGQIVAAVDLRGALASGLLRRGH